jgi:predicted nucleic acid-binding protein
MSSFIVFDTSVLVNQLRTNGRVQPIRSIRGPIRNSSVVLSELWRGAATRSDIEVLRALEKRHTILSPTEKNWLESGSLLGKLRTDLGFQSHKLRDLHFDVLIALTARSHGATLITSNRSDFELIRSYRNFDLEVW